MVTVTSTVTAPVPGGMPDWRAARTSTPVSPAPSERVVWVPDSVVSASTTDNSMPSSNRLISASSLVLSPSTVALPDTSTVSVPSVSSPSLWAVNWKVPVSFVSPAGMSMVNLLLVLSVQKSPLGVGVDEPRVAVPPSVMSTVTRVAEVLLEESTPAKAAVTVTSYGSVRSATVVGDTEISRSSSRSFMVKLESLTATSPVAEPPSAICSGPSVMSSSRMSTLNVLVSDCRLPSGMVSVSEAGFRLSKSVPEPAVVPVPPMLTVTIVSEVRVDEPAGNWAVTDTLWLLVPSSTALGLTISSTWATASSSTTSTVVPSTL